MAQRFREEIPKGEDLDTFLRDLKSDPDMKLISQEDLGNKVAVTYEDTKAPDLPDEPQGGGGGGPAGGGGSGSGSGSSGGAGGGPVAAASGDVDLLTLARTIYGEARGEQPDGREAVGHVVMNRVKKQGKSVRDVCLAKRQFSCWNENDPNSSVIRALMPGANNIFNECLATADRVIKGEVGDNTGNATHYYATSISAPNWTQPPARKTVQIGHHIFFTNVAM